MAGGLGAPGEQPGGHGADQDGPRQARQVQIPQGGLAAEVPPPEPTRR
ncbi:MAG: hypothetical protein ACRDRP_17235 [Pseudonocardiaceae bacterium]